MDSEMITLSKKEFEKLKNAYLFLKALEANGVDNWEGYSDAYQEAFPEEDKEY